MKKVLCPLAILAVIGAAAWWLWKETADALWSSRK